MTVAETSTQALRALIQWCLTDMEKENTHKEVVVAVCLPRIPDLGEPQRPRILRVRFRRQQRTRKRLLGRLGSEMSAKN